MTVIKSLTQFQPVRELIYYTVMISTSSFMTYGIYLYANGTV